MIVLFHVFAEVLYEANIVEQEQWQPGEYQLASLNFGSLDSHASFEVLLAEDALDKFKYRTSSSMTRTLETKEQISQSQLMKVATTVFG